ncbi:MAG: GNAT family N-acetyltransferase [Gammaproteobacteria bacterium]
MNGTSNRLVKSLAPEQAELWRQVERLWELAARKDANLIRQALHPDYTGWDTNAPMPHDREAAIASVAADAPRLVRYDLEPLSIRLYDGSVGIVHYRYRATVESADSNQVQVTGKWTEVYTRHGSGWLMVAVSGRPSGEGAADEAAWLLDQAGAPGGAAGSRGVDAALSVLIAACTSVEQPGWLAFRRALWPHCPEGEHLREMTQSLAGPGRHAQFMAYAEESLPAGFIEVSLRSDHVNGTESSPAAFVEGLYVTPALRRHGVARRLVSRAAEWAAERGCSELASDTGLANSLSRRVHKALGFAETERVVFFRKMLAVGDR